MHAAELASYSHQVCLHAADYSVAPSLVRGVLYWHTRMLQVRAGRETDS